MRIFFFVVIQCCFLSVFSQEKGPAILSLPFNTFDFGRIMEDGGEVSHRFSIENTGASALRIINVRTTCGCTSPSWTTTTIQPGGSGYLDVEFDPVGRSGDFHKTIQIQSTAENSNMFVSVSGTVVPALRKEELSYRIGDLAIKADQMNFGYLYKGAMGEEYLTVRNTTDAEMAIDFENVPDHVMLNAIPAELGPGEYGQIEVKYCTEKTPEWDVVIDEVTLVLNNIPVREKKLSIVANIREDFRHLTPEQRLTAPVAVFRNENILLDTISSNGLRDCRFLLTNTGKTDLKIRAVKASCGCTIVTPEKSTLAPGESTYIEAVFDPSGRSGSFKNGITVVTNDPAQYKKYLFVEGYILNRQD